MGIVHNQLTGNDDILSLDYSTASFESNAVQASYELPIVFPSRLRLRVFGLYSDFEASDVGFPGQAFEGQEINAGGEVAANVYQDGPLFLDVVAGARWQQAEVDNNITGVTVSSGDATFVAPYLGLRLQRLTQAASLIGNLNVSYGISDDEQSDLDGLRLGADDNYVLLQGDAFTSLYLEPLLRPGAFRDGELTTLAHEFALSVRGQAAFGNRLIPQNEQTAGGFYSVRGYAESAAVGDSAVVGTVEYRWHVPQGLPAPSDPAELDRVRQQTLFGQRFAYRPTSPYGRADWDLIVRLFADGGITRNSDAFAFETDDELLGVGGGLELQIRSFLVARVDAGVALLDIDDAAGNPEVESGDAEVHFSVTVSF